MCKYELYLSLVEAVNILPVISDENRMTKPAGGCEPTRRVGKTKEDGFTCKGVGTTTRKKEGVLWMECNQLNMYLYNVHTVNKAIMYILTVVD